MRALRILPAYAAALFFYNKLFRYVGNGPLFDRKYTGNDCDKIWWQNLLFIDDFTENWDGDNYCFGHSWYLSNDFHMFLTVPIIIFTLLQSRKIGAALIGVLFVLFSGISIYVYQTNEYTNGGTNPHNATF